MSLREAQHEAPEVAELDSTELVQVGEIRIVIDAEPEPVAEDFLTSEVNVVNISEVEEVEDQPPIIDLVAYMEAAAVVASEVPIPANSAAPMPLISENNAIIDLSVNISEVKAVEEPLRRGSTVALAHKYEQQAQTRQAA